MAYKLSGEYTIPQETGVGFSVCFAFLFSVGFAVLPLVTWAAEFTSTNFRVLDPVLHTASSTEMSSTNFRLTGTVGQIAIGTSTATNFNVSSGFLYFPFVKTPTLKVQAGNGGVALYWTQETGSLGWTVNGYSIGRATVSGGPYTYTSMGSTVTSSATTTTTTTTTNGTTYYFVVVVEDIFGNFIATSSEVSVTPSASYYNLTTADFDTTVASSSSFVGPDENVRIDITIPANVLSSGDLLHPVFTVQSESLATSDKPLPSGKLGANTFYDFSWFKVSDLSQVTSFDKSITLKFTYNDADISGIDDESTLAPYRWNGSSWVALSGYTLDTSANTVTVSTSVFSTFALLGTEPTSKSVSTPSTGGGIIESILKILKFPTDVVFAPPQCEKGLVTDLNCDGSVGLSDLSIFLYFSERQEKSSIDFNKDGRIGLSDVSILLYEWTIPGVFAGKTVSPEEPKPREPGLAFIGSEVGEKTTLEAVSETEEYVKPVFSAIFNFFRSTALKIGNFFVVFWSALFD